MRRRNSATPQARSTGRAGPSPARNSGFTAPVLDDVRSVPTERTQTRGPIAGIPRSGPLPSQSATERTGVHRSIGGIRPPEPEAKQGRMRRAGRWSRSSRMLDGRSGGTISVVGFNESSDQIHGSREDEHRRTDRGTPRTIDGRWLV